MSYHNDIFTKKRLPNLNDGKISKEKGAKMLYDALCKKCVYLEVFPHDY